MLHVLASGSSGNSYCIETDKELIFIDLGVTLTKVRNFIKSIEGFNKKISVLITHEHTDHISGLPAFLRNFSAKIYASEGTAKVLHSAGVDNQTLYPLKANNYYDFGSFGVKGFRVSHDAVDPFGYLVMTESGNTGFMTDLGCTTQEQSDCLQSADLLILESNHDMEMLKKGKYPIYLKRRIASAKGHLSNNDAISFLASLMGANLTQCLFAHVSEENNDYSILENLSSFCQKEYNIKTHVLRQHQSAAFSISRNFVLSHQLNIGGR